MVRFLSLFLLVLFCASPVGAQEIVREGWQENLVNLENFKALPVLHEGRVKPIDSFARIHLKKFSNQDTVAGLGASQWLAFSLFEPDRAAAIPVFKVRSFSSYGLPENKDRLYAYRDVLPVVLSRQDTVTELLKQEAQEWSADQQALVTLYFNVQSYTQILRSMTAILPIQSDKGVISNYLQLEEGDSAKAVIAAMGAKNTYFKINPINKEDKQSDWQSLWQVAMATPDDEALLVWQKLAASYVVQDQALWGEALELYDETLITPRLRLEYFYNKIGFLFWAGVFYGLSLLGYCILKFWGRSDWLVVSHWLLGGGALLSALDIGFRVYILARPPIGTLYESIIFVALVCALAFFIFEAKTKNGLGIVLGSLAGLIFILTAKSFAGVDTMDSLVAVLNTNFWLLTHVICITVGYGVCFLAALVAHYYLFMPLWVKNDASLKQQQIELMRYVRIFIIFALLFTTIGTILGGIWADQSWGRFWGWDPKENGALLIVLWIIWLLHGQISHHIGQVGFMVGAAFLSIIVVLAWFGVNLLNVGLHSYGFISGVMAGITAFCLIEICLISGAWLLLHRRKS